jgi:hypothetical protein
MNKLIDSIKSIKNEIQLLPQLPIDVIIEF